MSDCPTGLAMIVAVAFVAVQAPQAPLFLAGYAAWEWVSRRNRPQTLAAGNSPLEFLKRWIFQRQPLYSEEFEGDRVG